MFHTMASNKKGYYFNAILSSSSIGWSVDTAGRWKKCIILAERADNTEEAKLQ